MNAAKIAAQLAALDRRADLLLIEKTLSDAQREIAYASKPDRDREAIRTAAAAVNAEARAAHRAADRHAVAGVHALDLAAAVLQKDPQP